MDNITEKNVMRIAQKKNGKRWEDTYIDRNTENVYMFLASEMVHKKMSNCKYITSIKRKQCYSHVEICITYDNNCRSIYYLPTHIF